jgi:hypothetical protein
VLELEGGHHDIQDYDTQHKYIQHNGKKHDTQDSGSVVMLSVTYNPFMQRVMMLNVIMLCVVLPEGMLCSHFTKIVS